MVGIVLLLISLLLFGRGVLGVGWCRAIGDCTKERYVGEVGSEAILILELPLLILLLLTKGCRRRWRRGLARGRGVGVVVLLRGGVRGVCGEHEAYRWWWGWWGGDRGE